MTVFSQLLNPDVDPGASRTPGFALMGEQRGG
jgi:hypothetical protein